MAKRDMEAVVAESLRDYESGLEREVIKEVMVASNADQYAEEQIVQMAIKESKE